MKACEGVKRDLQYTARLQVHFIFCVETAYLQFWKVLRKQCIWKFWNGKFEESEKSVMDRLRSLYSEMKKDISSFRSPLRFFNEEGEEMLRMVKIPGTPTFREYSTTVRCASRAAESRAASRAASAPTVMTSPKAISCGPPPDGDAAAGGASKQAVDEAFQGLL